MALILIAEDDGGTQRLIATALRNQGHEILPAPDGLSAWRMIEMRSPDLVVSDINMPGMNGFALLQRLREHPTLALTPLVLLTSMQERRDMRHGMLMGADDYLTKPLQPRELVAAVDAQLNRQRVRASMQASQTQGALSEALEQQAWDLHEQYEKRLARELSEQWPQDDRTQVGMQLPDATVLYADILNYRQWTAALSASEMGMVIKRFYENSGDTVYLFGANTMQFVGEGVVAVYADSLATVDSLTSAPHSLRAMKAALGLRNAGSAMDAFVRDRLPKRQVPAFEVTIALHRGPVALARLEGFLGGPAQLLPVGETVQCTRAIQRLAPPVPGAVIVSTPALRSITGAVKPVARFFLPVNPPDGLIEVCAVMPLTGGTGAVRETAP